MHKKENVYKTQIYQNIQFCFCIWQYPWLHVWIYICIYVCLCSYTFICHFPCEVRSIFLAIELSYCIIAMHLNGSFSRIVFHHYSFAPPVYCIFVFFVFLYFVFLLSFIFNSPGLFSTTIHLPHWQGASSQVWQCFNLEEASHLGLEAVLGKEKCPMVGLRIFGYTSQSTLRI